MAEFQEVMRQWRRMCELHTCDNRYESELSLCPLIIKHNGYPCDDAVTDLSQESVAQIEQIVTAWAAEHPESVYPAWRDWLRDLYGNPNMTMTNILKSPIDPEIARRLDIVPKRVK